MDSNKAPTLVLGGTGHYGRHIVRSLLEKGQPVRVLTRNAANAREVLGDRAEIVEGDILERAVSSWVVTDEQFDAVPLQAPLANGVRVLHHLVVRSFSWQEAPGR